MGLPEILAVARKLTSFSGGWKSVSDSVDVQTSACFEGCRGEAAIDLAWGARVPGVLVKAKAL